MTHPGPPLVKPGLRKLAAVTILVKDYDEAAAWYRKKLNFILVEDADLGGGRRRVVVAPAIRSGARILFVLASGERQTARIGDQTGGHVGLCLETDDIARDFEYMRGRGVEFPQAPHMQPHGTVAVFADLYGNLFELIQPAAG